MKAQWQAEKSAISEIQADQGRGRAAARPRWTRPRGGATCRRRPSSATAASRELERAARGRTSAARTRCRRSAKYLKEEVDAEDIAEIVAKWTGIPVTQDARVASASG